MEHSKEVLDAIEDIKAHQGEGWTGQFYIGEGWYALVAELHNQLKELDPTYQVLQVKEKFGGLRYYTSPTGGFADNKVSDENWAKFNQLINAAEMKSYTICEDCGTTEHVTTYGVGGGHGWIRSLCTDCRKAANEARQKQDEEFRVAAKLRAGRES